MKNQHQGFTLIELMIVVAVVGILGAIAYPSYTEYIRRGHRADARGGLLQAQQWLERAATATGNYPANATDLPTALQWTNDNSKRYTIAYAPTTSGGLVTAYTLTATPRNAQTGDKCGAYTLSNTGLRGANGKKSGETGYNADCWGK